MNREITYAIVLYKNDSLALKKAVNSLLDLDLNATLFLIDNSPSDELRGLISAPNITYIHNPSNPGFGASHNVAIKEAINSGAKYHFIVNPDIYFTGDVVTPMINYMEKNLDVGMMMPEILNDDGSVQYLPKLLPSPFWIFRRKLKFPSELHKKFVSKYELRHVPRKTIYNSPILSGCFSLLRLQAVKELGAYDDERYFMYFEDFDLSRRIHKLYKTLYFPLVSVYHSYNSEANKSPRLFRVFISSAIAYFNKFGWFFDNDRETINNKTLSQFES